VAVVLILLRFNLIAIVSAQALSIIIKRLLSRKAVYTAELKRLIRHVKAHEKKQIVKSVYPNAVKVGLTGLGGFLVTRSSIIIGSLYLSLGEVASYGITIQIIVIISSIASVYCATYLPKIAQYRIQNNRNAIKHIYLKGCMLSVCVFLGGGLALMLLGERALSIIESKTPLLPNVYILLALLVSLLEANHAHAANIIATKNEIPFFKATLLSGLLTLGLTVIFLHYTTLGTLGMILAIGVAQGCYQNWKWPLELIRELNVTIFDALHTVKLKK
jgi:O-antigen/teichoic acid export membrane protein